MVDMTDPLHPYFNCFGWLQYDKEWADVEMEWAEFELYWAAFGLLQFAEPDVEIRHGGALMKRVAKPVSCTESRCGPKARIELLDIVRLECGGAPGEHRVEIIPNGPSR